MTPLSHPFLVEVVFFTAFSRDLHPQRLTGRSFPTGSGRAGHGKMLVAMRPVMRRACQFSKRLFLYFRSPGDQLPQLGCLLGEGNHQLGIFALGIEDLFEELIFRRDFTEHLLR